MVRCCVCGSRTFILSKDHRYLIASEDFMCSKKCLAEYILNGVSTFTDIPGERLHNRYIYRGCSDSIAYRSEYERLFAGFLSNYIGIPYGYEMFGFMLKSGTYTPDFYVKDTNIFIEVKGVIGVGFRKKLREFKELYKNIMLVFVPWILHEEFYGAGSGDVVR